jgi:hypothetical protein
MSHEALTSEFHFAMKVLVHGKNSAPYSTSHAFVWECSGKKLNSYYCNEISCCSSSFKMGYFTLIQFYRVAWQMRLWLDTYLGKYAFQTSTIIHADRKVKTVSYPRSMPWRHIRLWDVKDPTFSGKSAHGWR